MKNPKKNKMKNKVLAPSKPLTATQPHSRSAMPVSDGELAVGINGGHADQPRGMGKASRAMEGQRSRLMVTPLPSLQTGSLGAR